MTVSIWRRSGESSATALFPCWIVEGGGEAKEVTSSRRQADSWVEWVGLREVIGGVFCAAIVRGVTRSYWRGILLLQITPNFSNRSPCSRNGQWSADNDSELRSQSAMRASRAATRAAIVRGVTRSYWRGILLVQITQNFSNRSPCSRNGQWSADNDSELRSQSATRASRAAIVRGVTQSNWMRSYLVLDHVVRGEGASCRKLMASASSPNRYAKRNLFGPPSSRVRTKIVVRRISAEDARCIESQPVATVTPFFHNFS